MIDLAITLIIGMLVLAILFWIIDMMPRIPPEIKDVARVIVLVIAALWLIGVLVGLAPSVRYFR